MEVYIEQLFGFNYRLMLILERERGKKEKFIDHTGIDWHNVRGSIIFCYFILFIFFFSHSV